GEAPFAPGCGGATAATACAPPSTWISSPLIARDASEKRKQTAPATGEQSEMSQPSGAAASQPSASVSKPLIPLAAAERIGPAEIRLERIPAGPRSRAR